MGLGSSFTGRLLVETGGSGNRKLVPCNTLLWT